MKFSALATILASASAAYAHATVRAVFINGVDQGNGENTYIRSPPNNSPVKDLTSSDVACNVNNVAVPKTLDVSAGDVITFEWSHNTRNDDIIDASHKGPVLVYVAPTSSNGAGAVWSKIFQSVYDSQWATDTLIANKGHVSVTVPDLEAGEYLFRPELVTLHESDTAYNVNPARGVQLYMECIQFKVVSSGSVKLTDGIDFKTAYTYSDKGLVYNLYNADPKTYPSTSAAPATSAAASTSAAAPTTSAAAPATTEAAVTTSAAAPVATEPITTSRAPLPTSKMTTVTVRSSSAAVPTVTSAVATPSASSCPTAPSEGNSGEVVAKYYRCGGIGYTGSTSCAEGTTCVVQNPYYSQCL
ncbi:glycosyl hydrolase family 61-domain-containing protein [Rhizoctonia solani]|nr:glycosyl hydrolase family 61-domain-containing protein [Rhizoctonia solani]